MEKDDSWGTVEIPNNTNEDKVEYEVEEEQQELKAEPEVKEKTEVKEETEIKELEGIETSGAQKRIKQLVRQRKEREEQIQELVRQNEQLKLAVNVKNTEVNEINKVSLNASEKQLEDKIQLARAAYLDAFEEGEKEKLLTAQEMLNEAQNDLKAVTSAKINYEKRVAQQQQRPVQQQPIPQQPVTDPKAEEWASNNDWFGKDNVMTAAALAIDAELKEEGFSPNDNEFYQEIDNRIKNAFPQKFGEAQERVQENEANGASNTSTPAQVVSGSSRSSPSSKNKVKLTQEDMRLAEKWNIPLETYAAQKLKVAKADGEYTDVYK
jgi:hypothetical protein